MTTKLQIVDHPCVRECLTILRDRATAAMEFRETLQRSTLLIMGEALREAPVIPTRVETPLAAADGWRLATIVLVPVLRAGLGMLDAAQRLVPQAHVGFVGLERDEKTAQAHQYYCKLPRLDDDHVAFILDPMLATGGSLADTADILKHAGVRQIVAVTIISAPEGVALMAARHPDVSIYSGALDMKLTPNNYIFPGLGDAGDRLFGTL